MNAGKTKLLDGGGVLSKLCELTCGICSKGVAANSLQSTS